MLREREAHNPRMHCHDEVERDCQYPALLPDETLMKWSIDGYSTSRHLLTLYSMARGLNAKTVLEIGFGRSSFVLARAASENGGRFISCDSRDFSYLFTAKEKDVTTFVIGDASRIWHEYKEGIDFAFLDYFSDASIPAKYCANEIQRCLLVLRTNGIIAVHDSLVSEYSIKEAIEEVKSRSEVECMTLPYGFGMTLIRNKAVSPYGTLNDTFIRKPETQVEQ